MARLLVRELTRRVRTRVLLDGLQLEASGGEWVAVTGPAGSGKTTLLRTLAGLEEPETGSVLLDDAELLDLAPPARPLALVFQNHGLYPHLSVRENLSFGLETRRVERAEIARRVEEAAAAWGLAHVLETRPHRLSPEQYQRAAVARALLREPSVLLLDDPLGALEGAARSALRADLARLRRTRRCIVVMTSRDPVDALALGDRVAVLAEGRLQQCDDGARLHDRPVNRFVAAYVGSPPMNLVEVTVAGGRALLGGCSFPAPAGDATVVVGIRPEHVGFEPQAGALALRATVETVEPLGTTALAMLSVGGVPLCALCERRTVPAEGAEAQVWIAPSRVRFFAADDGRALAFDAEAAAAAQGDTGAGRPEDAATLAAGAPDAGRPGAGGGPDSAPTAATEGPESRRDAQGGPSPGGSEPAADEHDDGGARREAPAAGEPVAQASEAGEAGPHSGRAA